MVEIHVFPVFYIVGVEPPPHPQICIAEEKYCVGRECKIKVFCNLHKIYFFLKVGNLFLLYIAILHGPKRPICTLYTYYTTPHSTLYYTYL